MSNAELNSQSYLLSKATINGAPIDGDFILVDDKRAGNAWCKNVSGQVVADISQYFKLADMTLPSGSVAKFTLYAGYGDGIGQAGKTEIIISRNVNGVIALRLIDGTQTVLSELHIKNITGNTYSLFAKLQSDVIEDGFLEYNWSREASIDTDSVWTLGDGLLPSGTTAAEYENRWLDLKLINGFTVYGKGYATPQYIVKEDVVKLRGLVIYPSGWTNQAVFEIPPRYIPKLKEMVVCSNSGAPRSFNVSQMSPAVYDSPGAVPDWISLSNVSWSFR